MCTHWQASNISNLPVWQAFFRGPKGRESKTALKSSDRDLVMNARHLNSGSAGGPVTRTTAEATTSSSSRARCVRQQAVRARSQATRVHIQDALCVYVRFWFNVLMSETAPPLCFRHCSSSCYYCACCGEGRNVNQDRIFCGLFE